jgi:hypothetical protein
LRCGEARTVHLKQPGRESALFCACNADVLQASKQLRENAFF